jgi:TonB family protein
MWKDAPISKTVKDSGTGPVLVEPGRGEPVVHPRARGWIFLIVSASILLAVLCWRWERDWADVESDLPGNEQVATRPEAKVSTEVMEKLLIHRVDPDYPAAARRANLRGVIVLDVVVGRDGSVVETHALNGPDVLAQAAMDALRWWRFEPYRVDGKPVVAETTVAVEFKP